jgi:thymidylate kinase
VNSRRKANKGNPTIWLSIDPMTIKQRIDTITDGLERVRRKFESKVEAGYSNNQKED